ncbi:hypothetical protein GCM10020220_079040 [Nonomuraea rubra]
MDHVDAGLQRPFQQGGARRRAADAGEQAGVEGPGGGVLVGEQRGQDGRGAAQVGDAVLADQPPRLAGLHLGQADVPAPASVTAQGKHQPWQWNIGSVHR